MCLLEGLGHVKDAPRVRARYVVDGRRWIDGDGCPDRGRRQHLRHEYRKPGAADAVGTVLRARIRCWTACIRNAIVGDNAGEYFRPLHDKHRKPHGEEEASHEPTIPRVPFCRFATNRGFDATVRPGIYSNVHLII